MGSQSFVKKARWQFSLRAGLAAITLTAACLALVAVRFRQVAKRDFVTETVRPIIDEFVSSVGYSNGRILWLRVNNIDPHHPGFFRGYNEAEVREGMHEWVVPIAMDMYRNDGSFGPYRKFGDFHLKEFVADHPHLRALDLRRSGVTDAGLVAVSKLRELQWLWLDRTQSTELGLSHLHDVSSLRTIQLDVPSIDADWVGALQGALGNCEIENNADLAVAGSADLVKP
jgi:hypothetical protein